MIDVTFCRDLRHRQSATQPVYDAPKEMWVLRSQLATAPAKGDEVAVRLPPREGEDWMREWVYVVDRVIHQIGESRLEVWVEPGYAFAYGTPTLADVEAEHREAGWLPGREAREAFG